MSRHHKVYKRQAGRRMRNAVLERDGYKCTRCGRRDRLECDHIKPLAEGGTNEPSNLRTLCRRCNLRTNAERQKQHHVVGQDDWEAALARVR